MAQSNPFSALYSPQDISAQLAILQPAADNDAPIKLTLAWSNLKETSYECISYDRTEEADTVAVSVDGEDQPIPKALESALRTFRRKEKPRTLWADLLVGRTVEERSRQAAAQRRILENADKTLCWLGPDRGESTVAVFETIREMARRFGAACREVGVSPDANLSLTTMQQMAGLRWRLHDCPSDDLRSFDFAHWHAIYDVFSAAYWACPRCVPEIVLARCAVVVQGRGNVRWHDYVGASRALGFFHARFFEGVPLPPHAANGLNVANQIELAERRRRLGETIELLPMIQTARECSRSAGGIRTKDSGRGRRRRRADPRENVFAMIPIATPSGRVRSHNAGPQPLPSIDYAKSAQQVFVEAARYIVLERQDLLLWYGERPPCARRLRGLPSWVPDFGADPAKGGAVGKPNSGMQAWWGALPKRLQKPITVSIDGDSALLRVQARPLDRIVHVSPVFSAANYRRLCATEFGDLPGPSPSAAPSTPAETAEQRAERFWRTLVLNEGDGGGAAATTALRDRGPPAAEPHGTSFRSLVAEETILRALGCASPAELRAPENAARMRASPEIMALVPLCGRSGDFDALLLRRAAGRRFFRTEGGRFGMSAVEDAACVEGGPWEEDDDEDEDGEGEGELEEGDREDRNTQKTTTTTTAAGQPPRPPRNIGHLMADPMARAMMESFRQYLQGRDQTAARVAAQMMRGETPGQEQDARSGGVAKGDLVVACVGGFFPYVLRPRGAAGNGDSDGDRHDAASTAAQARPPAAGSNSTYEFVGECYLHGAMAGEDFKATSTAGANFWVIDASKFVDITIV
ncbi:hypothetical protein DL764_010560 [Monosporascus ibericus]|uniref:Heterokaryon incompatibility domain-containing protein n=1 Tax=Monosporascus ibericus TaxID=155417 RepID=A0A4Q4SSI6_9PEZI|nr:hypothetical protein DL764_010560 [Monosporascus ibericus]